MSMNHTVNSGCGHNEFIVAESRTLVLDHWEELCCLGAIGIGGVMVAELHHACWGPLCPHISAILQLMVLSKQLSRRITSIVSVARGLGGERVIKTSYASRLAGM